VSNADPLDLDRIAAELHAAGLRQTDKARRTFRDSFGSDEAYRAYMIELGKKARDAKRAAAIERRRKRAAEVAAKLVEPGATTGTPSSILPSECAA
jgi:hypothetical protein